MFFSLRLCFQDLLNPFSEFWCRTSKSSKQSVARDLEVECTIQVKGNFGKNLCRIPFYGVTFHKITRPSNFAKLQLNHSGTFMFSGHCSIFFKFTNFDDSSLSPSASSLFESGVGRNFKLIVSEIIPFDAVIGSTSPEGLDDSTVILRQGVLVRWTTRRFISSGPTILQQ